MFAIFLSEKMDPLYTALLAFPTVIFSGLMIFCIFYWLFAVIGLIDFDAFSIDADIDIEADADGLTNLDVLAGVLMKFGLNGIPLLIWFSIFIFLSWTTSLLTSFYIYPFIPDGVIQWLVNAILLVAIPYVCVRATGKLLAPLRPAFAVSNQEAEKIMQGQVAIVRSAKVDSTFGEAKFEDGGAGMILKIRTGEGVSFNRGDRVILLDYMAEQNAWLVISEQEFNA